jgi:hypothetical protein
MKSCIPSLRPGLLLTALAASLLLAAGCAQDAAPVDPAETEPVPAEETEVLEETETASAVISPLGGGRVIVMGNSPVHKLTEEEMAAYPQTTNLPALYIDLGSKSLNSVQHHVFSPGTYSIVYNGEGIIEMPLQIKGRGNYSWSFPQKTYGLKLDDAAPLLGMNAGKKWVLITTYSDKTLLRNFIGLNLASNIFGMEYAVQTRYVDLYVNGKYNGLYVLSQNITLGNGQVDADALFEIEAQYRHGDCSNCIICPSGTHIIFSEPIDEAATTEEHDALMSKYRQLIVKADVAITTKGMKEYSRFIDVDSFVDWYIVNELLKNYDSGFTTSCYMYVKDGKLHMGPCWDYDTCMGNQNAATCMYPEGYHVATSGYSPWYQTLTQEKDFKQAIHDRWSQLYDDGKIAEWMQFIDDQAKTISESQKLDKKKWPQKLKQTDLRGHLSLFTYDEELDYLKNWLNTRIAWLNSEWHN